LCCNPHLEKTKDKLKKEEGKNGKKKRPDKRRIGVLGGRIKGGRVNENIRQLLLVANPLVETLWTGEDGILQKETKECKGAGTKRRAPPWNKIAKGGQP